MIGVQKIGLDYPQDVPSVLSMWRAGMDTKDISSTLMATESEVYNFMSRIFLMRTAFDAVSRGAITDNFMARIGR